MFVQAVGQVQVLNILYHQKQEVLSMGNKDGVLTSWSRGRFSTAKEMLVITPEYQETLPADRTP